MYFCEGCAGLGFDGLAFAGVVVACSGADSGRRTDSLPARIEACARKLADSLCQEMLRPALRRHAIRATVQLLLRLDQHEKARA